MSVDQFFFPNEETEKSTGRRQLDSLLVDMSSRDLTIMTAAAKGIQEANSKETLLRPDIYFVAYKNLYTNDGAATKGVNDDTADGFSEEKVSNIIKSLADETYQPTPVRRTHIPKKNGSKKKRPLGIPTFTDKSLGIIW